MTREQVQQARALAKEALAGLSLFQQTLVVMERSAMGDMVKFSAEDIETEVRQSWEQCVAVVSNAFTRYLPLPPADAAMKKSLE